MYNSSKSILYLFACIGSISLLYFFGLVLHLPFWITVMPVLACMVMLYRFMGFSKLNNEEGIQSKLPLYVLLIAVALLLDKTVSIATKHGLWDAWSIWNYDVKFLTYSTNWQRLFVNTTLGHPDYPLALPASLAFFNRLFAGNFSLQIPFAFHFLVTLSIPLLIYLETYRRSLIWAAIILFLFVTNEDYISQGVSQLADALLALFFLLAFICVDQGKDAKNMLVFAAFFLGCCMWTKNEGIVIAGILILFNAKLFFNREHVLYFMSGIVFPLLALVIFKTLYAPPNDIVSAQGAITVGYLTQPHRYMLILSSLYDNLNKHYFWFSLFICAYLLWQLLRTRMPDKRMLIILTCGFAYLMIYVLNHNELEWQLHTSQTRLILHLMPSAVYIISSLSSNRTTTKFEAKFFSNQQHLQ